MRVCVTGGSGFLGQAVCRELGSRGADSITVPEHEAFDLTQADAVHRLYKISRPDVVINLAAEVGGIGANRTQPGRFFYANAMMGMHMIECARVYGVTKFVQIGTVCSYPKHCPIPFREDDLWNGYPEETNGHYGIAKKATLAMLQAYRQQYGLNGVYLIPVNLYGPGDDFDPESSHVIPALIRRFCDAKLHGLESVICWGSGEPSREFLFVDDAAEAIVRAAERVNDTEPINLGTGVEMSIRDLANKVADLVGFSGRIMWDPAQPDGQPRRRLDVTRAVTRLGWRAKTDLDAGLRRTIDWWRSLQIEPAASAEPCSV